MFIVVAFRYYRKWECSDRKRDPAGCVLRCVRGSEAGAPRRHRGQPVAAPAAAGPCAREAIPLRSNNIVKNPIYFSRTETHLNDTGRYPASAHRSGAKHYCYFLDPGTQFPGNEKNYAKQYRKVQKSSWNEPYSSYSFTKQSCSKMALYRGMKTESRWNNVINYYYYYYDYYYY